MTRLFLECAIRAALIVIGTWIVLNGMRVKVAAVKHRVWTAVLLLMLALPFWTAWGPRAQIRMLPASVERVVTETPPPLSAIPQGGAQVAPPANGTRSARQPLLSKFEQALLGFYLLGAFVPFTRLVIGTAKANRLVRESVDSDGIRTNARCVAPVTVGCLRPTVILPETWRKWSGTQLRVVIAHEGEHVRRRDPLVQWLALLNRAIFWFHPAAWWLERELSALAEEACDAVVIAQGHDPGDYAKILMNIARDVMDSGSRIHSVTVAMPGTRLPQRVRTIIDSASIARISRARAGCVLAVCAAVCALSASGVPAPLSIQAHADATDQTAPTANAAQTPSSLAFDAASLKERDHSEPVGKIGMQTYPGRLVELCASLNDLVWYAYHITWARPEGLPDWAKKPCAEGSPEYTYDFQATMPPDTTTDQARRMLQHFLAERFKLAAHFEKKDIPVYALVVAPGGFKLHAQPNDGPPPAVAQFACPQEDPACHRLVVASASQLAAVVGNTIGRPVLDKTGLKDFYIFDLRWAGDMALNSPLPSLAAALHDDFGLELKSETDPTDVLVVDHAEKPTPN